MEHSKNIPLTTGEIAKYCHVTHRGVLKWVASGKLKAYRTPGKHSRVQIEDFIAFLKTYDMPIPQEVQDKLIEIKRVLIVDDDRGIVQAISRTLLVSNKYEIDVAFDGFEAGQKFSHFKPHLVILDIRMPNLDGYHVCASIRKDVKNSAVMILAVSGINDQHEIKRMMDLGANGYLHKPFSNAQLQAHVEEMLGEKS
jgi:two-component system response regulator VicR